MSNNKKKLLELARIKELSVHDMIERASYDSLAAAICINPECNYTTEMEPDQAGGYCERCRTNTVVSCLVLSGII